MSSSAPTPMWTPLINGSAGLTNGHSDDRSRATGIDIPAFSTVRYRVAFRYPTRFHYFRYRAGFGIGIFIHSGAVMIRCRTVRRTGIKTVRRWNKKHPARPHCWRWKEIHPARPYTVKKRFASFPSPAGMSLPNSPWAGIMTLLNYSCLAGDGKLVNLFLRCITGWWKEIHPARPSCWRWKGKHPAYTDKTLVNAGMPGKS